MFGGNWIEALHMNVRSLTDAVSKVELPNVDVIQIGLTKLLTGYHEIFNWVL
jgi:hypothetical protein